MDFLGGNSDLAKDVIACQQDTSYLADFFEKINIATNKLQGKNITLVKSKTIIHGLINKLELYQQTLNKRDFHHFSQLPKMSHSITDNHLLIYVKAVKEDINVCFKYLLDPEVFHGWWNHLPVTSMNAIPPCRKCRPAK